MKYTNITGHGMALNVSHENIVDLEVSINTAKKKHCTNQTVCSFDRKNDYLSVFHTIRREIFG